jgi:transcriptional regulator with XRE-family HTH domain
MKELKVSLGIYLKNLRVEKGKTLHELAMKIDIDSPLISKIERGHRLPTKQQLKKFSTYFDVDEGNLTCMLTTEKILKEFGVNNSTYEAVKNVEKELALLLKIQ